jgi:DNA (cytosine-5)-methyltransferase 1
MSAVYNEIEPHAGLRYGSVCSGIEAATCAWHPLGWKPQFFSEVDSMASRFLAAKYPETPNLGDMTKFKEWPDATINVLVGGTPCQSFSVAGLRKGMADPRGNLALTYLAIADRYRPEWLVWENVPGVLSSNGGRDFGSILGGMAELGYGFAYRVLDAQYVRVESHLRAVPQRRRRVLVVGHLGDWRRAAAVLFERESLSGNPPPRREAGKGLARDVAPSLTGSGRGVERAGETRGQDPVVAVMCADVAPTLNAHFGEKQGLENQHIDGGGGCSLPPTSMCLNAGSQQRLDPTFETLIPTTGGVFDVAHTLRSSFDASEDGSGRGLPLVAGTMKALKESGGWSNSVDHAAGGYMVPHAFPGRMSGTQVAAEENLSPSIGASNPTAVATSQSVRRLTPLECTRLQGFPDSYFECGLNRPLSDGAKYKMLGNSMAVNCMSWIGQRIDALNIERKAA